MGIEMKSVSLACLVLGALNCLVQEVYGEYVTLTNDGPCVKGGRIVFRADVFDDGGGKPDGTYMYKWKDDGLVPHEFESEATTNTTFYYEVDYPADKFPVGLYTMEIVLKKRNFFHFWEDITSRRDAFEITTLMNGNMSVLQNNNTLINNYVASGVQTKFRVDLRKGDDYYVKHNSSDSATFWFVDCKYYGMTSDFSFNYKFPKTGTNHTIEALVIASHEPPTTTTTVAPTTTPMPTTTVVPPHSVNGTASNFTIAVTTAETSTTPGAAETTAASPTATIASSTNATNATNLKPAINETGPQLGNLTFPFVCLNNSIIPADPKKTYGYFHRDITVKEAIGNITVEGTNWIQPWQTLALNITCPGSGPFKLCLRVIQGQYNVTGNETCDDPRPLETCKFNISHYFLESGVQTVLVALTNDVSKHVFPLTITVYEAIKKPQLSVIVVPVSCSLAAVVLIIFGVAYYIQSRARFTVEVADFDFGQTNPEMEYKTFTERLRDSFNNSGYKQLNPDNAQWREGCGQTRGLDQ